MRVAIDGRPLQDEVGGVKRYLQCVLPLLAADADLVVLHDPRRPDPEVPHSVDAVAVKGPRRGPALAWLEVGAGGWLRRHRMTFHGTYYAVPMGHRGPAVTTLYDISWRTHPEGWAPAKRALWDLYARRSVRSGPVITVSEFSSAQIARVYAVHPDRIRVAPAGWPTSAPVPPVIHPGLPERYVATLGGGLGRRRGLAEAVDAWRLATRDGASGVELVVVGTEAPPPLPRVHHLGMVDDATWSAILAGAEAFVYATRFEGYGLPAAEALAAGAPLVCARVAALPEVVGDAAAWADAPTGAALGEQLAHVLDDAELREALHNRALARAAAGPTWEDAAEVHLRAYRAAVGDFRR